MRLTVPGNLLLLGEYAVTEPGGLGMALAVDRRVILESEPARGLSIEGSWGGDTVLWREEDGGGSPLISAVVESCRRCLAGGCGSQTPRRHPPLSGHLRIDSSAFFREGVRKAGLGSSAAVAVALTWALLCQSGMEEGELRRYTARVALQAHRQAQGGRGSGYDVFASLFGGLGCLIGGPDPAWQAVSLPWLPELYLFEGNGSVSTLSALHSYERWKSSHRGQVRSFLERSNRGLREFIRASSLEAGLSPFQDLKELGIWLGDRIGISAAVVPPAPLEAERCKAVGAGNELGVYLAGSGSNGVAAAVQAGTLEPAVVAARGIEWLT
jgi:phosphomevalonate kinase